MADGTVRQRKKTVASVFKNVQFTTKDDAEAKTSTTTTGTTHEVAQDRSKQKRLLTEKEKAIRLAKIKRRIELAKRKQQNNAQRYKQESSQRSQRIGKQRKQQLEQKAMKMKKHQSWAANWQSKWMRTESDDSDYDSSEEEDDDDDGDISEDITLQVVRGCFIFSLAFTCIVPFIASVMEDQRKAAADLIRHSMDPTLDELHPSIDEPLETNLNDVAGVHLNKIQNDLCPYDVYSYEFFSYCGGYFSYSKNYYDSRRRFRNLTQNILDLPSFEIPITYIRHDLRSKDDLSIDVSLLPGGNREELIIHICGVHGVEAPGGCAIQYNLLTQYLYYIKYFSDDEDSFDSDIDGNNNNNNNDNNEQKSNRTDFSYFPFISFKRRPNILFVHAYNPFGYLKGRRVNGNNVDLSRNLLLTRDDWFNVLNRHPNYVQYSDFDYLFNPKPDNLDKLIEEYEYEQSHSLRSGSRRNKNDESSHIAQDYDTFDFNNLKKYVDVNYYTAPFSVYDTLMFYLNLVYFTVLNEISIISRAIVTGQWHNDKGIYYGGSKLQSEHLAMFNLFEKNSLIIPSAYGKESKNQGMGYKQRKKRRAASASKIIDNDNDNLQSVEQLALKKLYGSRTFLNFYDKKRLKSVKIVDVHSGLGDYGMDTLMAETKNDYSYLKDILNMSNNEFSTNYDIVNQIEYMQWNNNSVTKDGMYKESRGHLNNWCKYWSDNANDKIDVYTFYDSIAESRKNVTIEDSKSLQSYLIKPFKYHIDCTYITQEFGTLSSKNVFKALRDENTIWHYKKYYRYSDVAIGNAEVNLRDAFYPEDDINWKNQVTSRGSALMRAVLTG